MIASGIRRGMRAAGLVLVTMLLVSRSESVALAAGPVTVTKAVTPERALRFEVTVPASLDEVWAAFTTSDGLATWLWRDTRVDARPGGDWLAIFSQSTGGGRSSRSRLRRSW